VDVSNGGSGKQARAIIDGLEADVATLGLAYDIDVLHDKANLISADCRIFCRNHSAPYTSTIVLLVRAGNPKKIKDWNDLAVRMFRSSRPIPRLQAGPVWNFLAAWVMLEKIRQ